MYVPYFNERYRKRVPKYLFCPNGIKNDKGFDLRAEPSHVEILPAPGELTIMLDTA